MAQYSESALRFLITEFRTTPVSEVLVLFAQERYKALRYACGAFQAWLLYEHWQGRGKLSKKTLKVTKTVSLYWHCLHPNCPLATLRYLLKRGERCVELYRKDYDLLSCLMAARLLDPNSDDSESEVQSMLKPFSSSDDTMEKLRICFESISAHSALQEIASRHSQNPSSSPAKEMRNLQDHGYVDTCAVNLMLILYHLNATEIPELLVYLPCEAIKKQQPVYLHDRTTLEIFQDKDQLEKILKRLKDTAHLKSGPRIDPEIPATQTVKINHISKCRRSVERDASTWYARAFSIILQIFPVDRSEDQLYGCTGRVLLQSLQSFSTILRHEDQRKMLRDCQKRHTAEILLSASYFGDLEWKATASELARSFLESTDVVLLERIARRREQLLRNWDFPPRVYMGASVTEEVQRPGEILLKECRSLLDAHKAEEALAKLYSFSATDSSSDSLLRQRIYLEQGILLRYMGKTEEAFHILRTLRKEDVKTWPETFLSTVSHIFAGILCELGQFQWASDFIRSRIEEMKAVGLQHIDRVLDLHLITGEISLQQKQFGEAETQFQHLEQFLMGKNELNRANCTRLLRVHFGQARSFQLQGQWEKAIGEWTKARATLQRCNWKPGFSEVVIFRSQANAYRQLGRHEMAALYEESVSHLGQFNHYRWPCLMKWLHQLS